MTAGLGVASSNKMMLLSLSTVTLLSCLLVAINGQVGHFDCSAGPGQCVCEVGWEGDNCNIDINECMTAESDKYNECEWSDSCVNTMGSYNCSCMYPDQLAMDNRRCLGTISITAVEVESRWINIQYIPPVNDTLDGPFEGVSFNCTALYHLDSSIKLISAYGAMSANVSGLIPYTDYLCCATPQWISAGNGRIVCTNVTTMEDIPGNYPQSFTAMPKSSSSIMLQWAPPDPPNGFITNFTIYINYTNGSGINVRTVSGDISFYLLQLLVPHQLVGISISASNVVGEGPKTETVFIRTLQDTPGPVQSITVSILSQHFVNISWHPPSVLNGIIVSYDFNIFSLPPDSYRFTKTVLPEHDFFIALHNLRPFIPYYVHVIAETAAGKGELSPVQFFTTEGSPQSFPVITDVERVSPDNISVTWNPMSLESLRGFLTSYRLTVSQSIYSCSSTKNHKDIETINTLAAIANAVPGESYCISVSAGTNEGYGPQSPFRFVASYGKSAFQLHIMGIPDCEEWLSTSVSEKTHALKLWLASFISVSCNCTYSSTYIISGRYLCDRSYTGSIVFQGELISSPSINSSHLLAALRSWARSSPTVNILGSQYTIDGECNVQIRQLGVAELDGCTVSSGGHSQTLDPALIGTVTGITVALVLLILLSFVAVSAWLLWKRSRKNIGSETTMEYSARSQAVRIGRKTSNAFELANPLYGDTMPTRTAMSNNDDDARMIANAGNN